LAQELTWAGHRVTADTVVGLLREEGSSLQANAKTIEGSQHPDRDAQFRYLAWTLERGRPAALSALARIAARTVLSDDSTSVLLADGMAN
jgi:hypothetical protein